jgi:hypothetical protein
MGDLALQTPGKSFERDKDTEHNDDKRQGYLSLVIDQQQLPEKRFV